jgi:NADPH:quinone reductase-like Zn-dependent oxidoreductase
VDQRAPKVLEKRLMRSIVHRELGDPALVLRLEETPAPVLTPLQITVRTNYAPIHPGDLLGVQGSPAAGTPPAIGAGGRVPGFEGMGVVTEVGRGVNLASGIKPGARVAFFPASSTWSEQVVAPAGSVVLLPENVSDSVGAQMLINTVTALTALRAAHDSLPLDAREDVVAIVTAAGSAVGRLIVKLLIERGVFPIQLVRSEAGAAALAKLFPGSPAFATETDGWTERVREAAGGRPIHVAIDSVGGRLLGAVADLLVDGAGTVVNFGSLGGELSDIRIFPPRSLTLKAVMVASWMRSPPEQRAQDVAVALRLAAEPAGLFEVADYYGPSRIAEAVAHVGRPGKIGAVLLDFSEKGEGR